MELAIAFATVEHLPGYAIVARRTEDSAGVARATDAASPP
jgi:hypothetical protein